MKPGIYLVHKPVGTTSFSLVQAFIEEARRTPGRKLSVCHGGTLDPFARGLLLILVGEATKLFEYLHGIPKTYVAEIAWGTETDNGDPGGRVVAEGDSRQLTPEQIEHGAQSLLGWTEQIPPSTSAKRVGGERAYERVHRGEDVSLPPSRVYLHGLRWSQHALPDRSVVELTCRGGYYVRSFARDLGRSLGCPAHLAALHRTRIALWEDPGPSGRIHVAGAALLPWWPSRELSDQEVGALRRGAPIDRGQWKDPDWPLPPGFPGDPLRVRGFHLGRFVAVLAPAGDGLRLERALRGGL